MQTHAKPCDNRKHVHISPWESHLVTRPKSVTNHLRMRLLRKQTPSQLSGDIVPRFLQNLGSLFYQTTGHLCCWGLFTPVLFLPNTKVASILLAIVYECVATYVTAKNKMVWKHRLLPSCSPIFLRFEAVKLVGKI